MSNIKDIRCKPRLHDLQRRRWVHAPARHAASQVDHEKGVAWVSISIHACIMFLQLWGSDWWGSATNCNFFERAIPQNNKEERRRKPLRLRLNSRDIERMLPVLDFE